MSRDYIKSSTVACFPACEASTDLIHSRELSIDCGLLRSGQSYDIAQVLLERKESTFMY